MKLPKRGTRTLAVCIVLLVSVLTVGGLVSAAPSETGSANELSPVTAQQSNDSSLVFAPRVFQDIGGQVAVEDGEVAVRGVARGFDAVLVTMIDRRGRIASEIVTVDDDDIFEEDVSLVTPDGTELSEGPIAAAVFAPGRDGVMGDGEIAGFTRADLEALDESTREKVGRQIANQSLTRTQQQVLELFYEESINDTGSDDQVLFDVFKYTDGRTSIRAVTSQTNQNVTGINPVTQNETIDIRGRTNRKPTDNTIVVEVIDGPSSQQFDVATTEEWGQLGVWSVTLDVPSDAEPGNYTLRSDDGDDTDIVELEVRPDGRNATSTQTGNGTQTSSETQTTNGTQTASSETEP